MVSEDIKEVKNYRNAFNLVFKEFKRRKGTIETLIKSIHKELLKMFVEEMLSQ